MKVRSGFSDMVRHANAETHNFAASRARALPTVAERLASAEERERHYKGIAARARSALPRVRWQFAAEAVSCGCALVSFARQSPRALVGAALRAEAKRCEHAVAAAAVEARKSKDYSATNEARVALAAVLARCPAGVMARILLSDTSSKAGHKRARELHSELRRQAKVLAADVDESESALAALSPYIHRLRLAADAMGEDAMLSTTIEQSGFAGIHAFMEQKEVPSCMICHGELPRDGTVTTACVHLACAGCILRWLDAAPVLTGSTSSGEAPCPLCRKLFTRASLIKLLPPDQDAVNRESSDGAGSGGAGAGCSGNGAGAAVPSADEDDGDAPPRHTPAATEEGLGQLELPGGVPTRNARYPSLPPLFMAAHAQLNLGSMLGSKRTELLRIVTRVAEEGHKVVVFSQYPEAVRAASEEIGSVGLGCAVLTVGVSAAERARAVSRFNVDPACVALALHGSAAAAGLTLTTASCVVLLEVRCGRRRRPEGAHACSGRALHGVCRARQVH